jgi:hypothetical protein
VARYIRVRPACLAGILAKKAGNALGLSPYEAPVALVGRFDQAARQFWLSFEYLDEEPARQIASADGIELFEGRNSRKLLHISILLENPALNPTEISRLKTRVMDLLGYVEQRQDSAAKHGADGRIGWDVAKELLSLEFSELTEELVAAVPCNGTN